MPTAHPDDGAPEADDEALQLLTEIAEEWDQRPDPERAFPAQRRVRRA